MDTTFRTEEPEPGLEPLGPVVRWLVSWLMVAVPAAGSSGPPTLCGNRGACDSKYIMPDLDLFMMLGTVR